MNLGEVQPAARTRQQISDRLVAHLSEDQFRRMTGGSFAAPSVVAASSVE
jgi:hypothetical protein